MATVLVPILAAEPTTTPDPAAAGMTWLEIVQRLRHESGMGDTGPTSTLDQAGDSLRLVNWAHSAWLDIQQHRPDWDWMWESAEVTITAGTNVAGGDIPALRYDKDATYNGTNWLEYRPWREFSAMYREVSDGTPDTWTIRPDKAIVVNAQPSEDLVLTVERYRNPTLMTEDDSVPELPGEFHMLIVWRALILYSGYDEAGMLMQHARREWDRLSRLAGWYETAPMELGGPLA